MRDIDALRNRLHESIRRGNKEEILIISQRLDVEIVKFMQERLSYQEWKPKKQDWDKCEILVVDDDYTITKSVL